MSIIERIDEFNKKFPEYLIKRKYELLKADPFSFFRGTNHIFYEDLNQHQLSPSPDCWICGDLHLENFGTFKGDNRLVYFDLNDFDESILANVSWEIVRVITSILIGFHSLKITDEEALKSLKVFLKKYSQVLSEGKPRYIEPQTAKGIVRRFLNKVKERSDGDQLLGRTKKKDNRLHLSKYGGRQIQINKILKKQLIEAFNPWMESNNKAPNNYKVLDVRFRFAGTGSVGINRYVFLIQKVTDNKKHMLVDMKEATHSSLYPFVKVVQPKWESESGRMITVQRIMQNTSPAQLSSMNFQGKDFVMQELQPTKDRINFNLIENKFQDVCNVIEDMALLTASAHLRGAGRKGSCLVDDLMNFGVQSHWQNELTEYAIKYKNVMIEYYDEFKNGKSSLV
ncbi:MAG: DUF2252 domain-containing protein [Ginsengibacter sp.]